ncbi:CoA-transferase family III and CoA-transferase family III domain-containing protein [Strongyloides ratti]|uniref:CoA-transferase family III and CoA-transferase family III domain-containing protein n=1 Tax=Strongyloides ratti TaxID=34506 RepID=A0A090KV19_STRRB|nr:CoA-transferase family III and CoA-transferase family III domain-containing protein [Strongyloides ratti]CEF61241.1 CoA-transferase family III and CoA-transferase family III domain-containing protein [Strongyloides ratti]
MVTATIQKTSRRYSTKTENIYKTIGTRTRDLSFTAPLNLLNVVLLNQAPVSNFTAHFFKTFGATIHKYCEDTNSSNIFKNYEKDYKTLNINRDNAKNEIIHITRQADLLIDNLADNRLNNLNVNYDELMKINSRLIIAKTTSYPTLSNKSCEQPSELSIAFSSESISSVLLNSEETNLQSPYIINYAKSVVTSAEMFIISQILMALYETNISGNRQVLNLSIQNSIENVSLISHKSESKIQQMYNRIYRTKDNGYVVVGICDENDINEFLNDLHLDITNNGALKGIDEDDIARIIETKTSEEWRLKFKFCGYINVLKSGL